MSAGVRPGAAIRDCIASNVSASFSATGLRPPTGADLRRSAAPFETSAALSTPLRRIDGAGRKGRGDADVVVIVDILT